MFYIVIYVLLFNYDAAVLSLLEQ